MWCRKNRRGGTQTFPSDDEEKVAGNSSPILDFPPQKPNIPKDTDYRLNYEKQNYIL